MLNRLEVIGHLGKDPEIRYLPSGDAVCNFSVATTEKWKDKSSGEQREETEWHRISVFGKLAEICGKYLTKGSLVYVAGKVQTKKYNDRDGVEKYSTGMVANEMRMLGGKQDRSESAQANDTPQRKAPSASPAGGGSGFDDMDDIPFITCAMAYDITTSKQRKMSRYDY